MDPQTQDQRPDRKARSAELHRKTKRQLVLIHRQGAGCLMSQTELMRWTHEELENAILESEYGMTWHNTADDPADHFTTGEMP